MRRSVLTIPLSLAVLGLAACTSIGAPPLVTGSTTVPGAPRVTRDDDARNCQDLASEVSATVPRIAALPGQARAERGQPPATLFQVFGRAVSGPGDGLPAHDEFERLAQRIDGLARLMRARGCPVPDVAEPVAAVKRELGGI